MTILSIDEDGVDAVYEGHEFRLERELIEEATQKSYGDVTDHEVIALIEESPSFDGEPRRIGDVI
ncbi:MAG: DUF5800 family protein [Halobacteriaceae archaeon]